MIKKLYIAIQGLKKLYISTVQAIISGGTFDCTFGITFDKTEEPCASLGLGEYIFNSAQLFGVPAIEGETGYDVSDWGTSEAAEFLQNKIDSNGKDTQADMTSAQIGGTIYYIDSTNYLNYVSFINPLNDWIYEPDNIAAQNDYITADGDSPLWSISAPPNGTMLILSTTLLTN